jgi:hypothetical protein
MEQILRKKSRGASQDDKKPKSPVTLRLLGSWFDELTMTWVILSLASCRADEESAEGNRSFGSKAGGRAQDDNSGK